MRWGNEIKNCEAGMKPLRTLNRFESESYNFFNVYLGRFLKGISHPKSYKSGLNKGAGRSNK